MYFCMHSGNPSLVSWTRRNRVYTEHRKLPGICLGWDTFCTLHYSTQPKKRYSAEAVGQMSNRYHGL